MKIDQNEVLKSLNDNGGILTSFGDTNKSNLLNIIKKTITVSALVSSFSVSASTLPNQLEEPTGHSVQHSQAIINSDKLDNVFNNNFIVLNNLRNSNYLDEVSNSISEERILHMLEDITKDSRNIKTILNEVQRANHSDLKNGEIYIAEFDLKINKDAEPEYIQEKLLEISNNHENEDIRVRAKVMAFIITNEGLSSDVGLDAQNHLTVGYGYDVDQQILSRTNSQTKAEFAKKHVYKELASIGLDVNQLVRSYNGSSHKITVSPVQATLLSAKTMDRYLAYAKTAAGPRLWGIVKDGDVKPSDYYRKAWTEEKMAEKGEVYNSYFVLDDRMKAAYVYSAYNFGPKSFGNKVRSELEKGNSFTAINSISSTWKDKHGVVHKNYRWMNNMAFAMTSEKTMMTFINKDSDKYTKTEIRQALTSEDPQLEIMLKLQQKYNENIYTMSNYDIKELEGKQLTDKEKLKYSEMKIQSDGILVNMNKIRIEMGENPIEGYNKEIHLTNFKHLKEMNELSQKFTLEKEAFNLEKIVEYEEGVATLKEKYLPNKEIDLNENPFSLKMKMAFLSQKNKDFELSDELRNNPDLIEIKKIAIEKQDEEIKSKQSTIRRKF